MTQDKPEKRSVKPENQIAYSRSEEWINRITHLVGAAAAVAASVAMIVKAAADGLGALSIVAVCLYGFALIELYTMSTLYHWMPVGKVRRAVFRRFDHCSVALLIAGTYAPFMLIGVYATSPVWGVTIASVVLAMALLACVFNAIDVSRFKVVCMICYVVMGWACVIRIDLIYRISQAAFWYLLAGGIVYTLGIALYACKKIPYNHAIWHFFVLAGSALHFIAIYGYLI